MDAQTLMNITQQLAVGLLDSCKIFFLTLLFSMPLGLLVTFGRMSKWAPLKFLAPQTLVEKLKLAQQTTEEIFISNSDDDAESRDNVSK